MVSSGWRKSITYGLGCVLALASLFLFFTYLRGKNHSQTPAEKAKSAFSALISGNYTVLRSYLPPTEPQAYGLTESQMEKILVEYVMPEFKQGYVGELSSITQKVDRTGFCSLNYQYDKGTKAVPIEVHTSYREVNGVWGDWVDLNSILIYTWILRGARDWDRTQFPAFMVHQAQKDRSKLQAMGLYGFQSTDSKHLVTWDQQLKWLSTQGSSHVQSGH